MNPWWLRPPAEEGPAKDKPAPKSEKKPKEKRPPESPKKEPTASARKSSRSRTTKRRRSPDSGGQRKRSSAPRLALFLDAECLAWANRPRTSDEIDLQALLAGLADRGRLVAQRAYGDWSRSPDLRDRLHQAGIEVVDSPSADVTSGRSAAISLTIDAVELVVGDKSCEAVALVSHNEALLPLVARLREAGIQIVGIGDRQVAAAGLQESCDEYLELAELVVPAAAPSQGIDADKEPVFAALAETIRSMESTGDGVIWGSMLKREMRRRLPDMDITGLGYTTFTDLLEDAERHEVIHLERDDRSGSYYVTGLVG